MAKTEPPWPKATPQDLLDLFAGNEDAARMVRDIAFWSHVYDDLHDRDKPVSDEQLHAVMFKLLVALPENPFYAANERWIRPLIVTGILNWHAANQMQASGCLEELRIAHAIRYSIADVALLTMTLTGGQDHAMKNARRCRLLSQWDTWANYRAEHHPDKEAP